MLQQPDSWRLTCSITSQILMRNGEGTQHKLMKFATIILEELVEDQNGVNPECITERKHNTKLVRRRLRLQCQEHAKLEKEEYTVQSKGMYSNLQDLRSLYQVTLIKPPIKCMLNISLCAMYVQYIQPAKSPYMPCF